MWATDLDLSSSRRMLEHDTANTLCANAHNYKPLGVKKHKDYYKRLRTVLADYHDATLHRLSVSLPTTTHNFQLLEIICYDNLTEETVNDWYMMVEHNIKRNAVARFAAGLTMYKNLVQQHDGHYPAARLVQVTAIIFITEYLFSLGKAATTENPQNLKIMTYVAEEALRDQIDTNDDPTALADIIISRYLTTGKEVADFLATANQLQTPLKDGAL